MRELIKDIEIEEKRGRSEYSVEAFIAPNATAVIKRIGELQGDVDGLRVEIDAAEEEVKEAKAEIAGTNAKLKEVEGIAKGANQCITYSDYAEMITVFNAMPRDKYRQGQDVRIITVNVPDLWVAYIEETNVEYSYVNDEAFVNALKADGFVQVGYYKFGMLETQKVDLTEYATKSEVLQEIHDGDKQITEQLTSYVDEKTGEQKGVIDQIIAEGRENFGNINKELDGHDDALLKAKAEAERINGEVVALKEDVANKYDQHDAKINDLVNGVNARVKEVKISEGILCYGQDKNGQVTIGVGNGAGQIPRYNERGCLDQLSDPCYGWDTANRGYVDRVTRNTITDYEKNKSMKGWIYLGGVENVWFKHNGVQGVATVLEYARGNNKDKRCFEVEIETSGYQASSGSETASAPYEPQTIQAKEKKFALSTVAYEWRSNMLCVGSTASAIYGRETVNGYKFIPPYECPHFAIERYCWIYDEDSIAVNFNGNGLVYPINCGRYGIIQGVGIELDTYNKGNITIKGEYVKMRLFN